MSNPDVTPQEALVRLGASTAEAVAQVFEMYAPGLVERGEVTVLPDAANAFDNLPFGAIAASVSYVDGVTGANVFVMSPAGARALAGAMGVPPPEEPEDPADESSLIAAHRARTLGGLRVGQSDDGRRSQRDQRRARPGDRDLPARDPGRRRSGLGRRPVRPRSARDVDDVPDRERGLPPDPARSERLRRADGPGDRRALDGHTPATGSRSPRPAPQRQARAVRRRAASPSTRRWKGSRCACGPSSAAPSCRSAAPSIFPSGPSSTSTARPTPPSTSLSTACDSLKVSCSSPMTVSGQ